MVAGKKEKSRISPLAIDLKRLPLAKSSMAPWWNGRRDGLKIHYLMRMCRFESDGGHHYGSKPPDV